MPHLISFTRGTSLVLSFPHYLAEHAHFSSLKQLYGLHLCLYIYWYSTVVVLLPDPKLESQPCWVNEGDIYISDMGYDRYKFIVQVAIGEQRGEGVK